MDLLSSALLVFLSFHGAKSTFSPSGSVSIDCGGQQTFTCTVTVAASGPAAWFITGLQGVTAGGTNGVVTAINNARVTSAETVAGLTSTITITGFTTADNGGTIRCDDQAAAVEGSATVLVGVPSCSTNVRVTDRSSDFSSATITWDQPTNSPPVTSDTVVTCNSSCTDMPCSSGSSTCRVLSFSTCEDYSVTVLSMNSCGSSTGCTGNVVAVPSQANCSIPSGTPPPPGCPLCWWLLLLLLPLLILVGYSISVALVWHLYYKDYNYCQVYWCCCFCKPREGDGKIRTSSTEPMKASPPPPPAPVAVAAAPLGEYADPKDVRKRKEENKIQYADLEFTKRSGGGQGSIHQKEEPVTYTAIQHA